MRYKCTVEQTESRLFVLHIPVSPNSQKKHVNACTNQHYKQRAKELERAAKKQAMILEESALALVSTEKNGNDNLPKDNENGRLESPH